MTLHGVVCQHSYSTSVHRHTTFGNLSTSFDAAMTLVSTGRSASQGAYGQTMYLSEVKPQKGSTNQVHVHTLIASCNLTSKRLAGQREGGLFGADVRRQRQRFDGLAGPLAFVCDQQLLQRLRSKAHHGRMRHPLLLLLLLLLTRSITAAIATVQERGGCRRTACTSSTYRLLRGLVHACCSWPSVHGLGLSLLFGFGSRRLGKKHILLQDAKRLMPRHHAARLTHFIACQSTQVNCTRLASGSSDAHVHVGRCACGDCAIPHLQLTSSSHPAAVVACLQQNICKIH